MFLTCFANVSSQNLEVTQTDLNSLQNERESEALGPPASLKRLIV